MKTVTGFILIICCFVSFACKKKQNAVAYQNSKKLEIKEVPLLITSYHIVQPLRDDKETAIVLFNATGQAIDTVEIDPSRAATAISMLQSGKAEYFKSIQYLSLKKTP